MAMRPEKFETLYLTGHKMNLQITLFTLAFSALGFAFSSWRAARPTQFGKVRMMPWLTLSIVFAFISILMLVHLVNLAGLQTGNR